MGDRANLGIRGSDGNTIFLYLHWGGSEINETMAQAIAKAMVRDGDESYFTRIFVSSVIGLDWNRETGVGMLVNKLPSSGDGYDVPVYDYVSKEISIHSEKWDEAGGYIDLEPIEEYDRDIFIAKYGMVTSGANNY